jgi:hypothetical protein
MYCRIKSDEHAVDALRSAIARLKFTSIVPLDARPYPGACRHTSRSFN